MEDAHDKIEEGWQLKRLKYMMITNPNNPTGTVLKRRVLEEVVASQTSLGSSL